MKKLIITILAIVTMALAEDKPVCMSQRLAKDLSEDRVAFICKYEYGEIDSTRIFVSKDMSSLDVIHFYHDGSTKQVFGFHHHKGYHDWEYVDIEVRHFDEFGVKTKDTIYVVEHTLDYYYKSLRSNYKFVRKK